MQNLYVKTQEKIRVDKKKYTFEQVNDPTFKSDYGRLINRGYVVFDFDEQPHINIISKIIDDKKLKCKKLITTRGVQYMFKTKLDKISCKNHEFNWLGLLCDIKGVGTQEQDKTAYQAIKVNGKIRQEEFLNCSSDEELDIAPSWLYHVPKKKEQIDLTKDKEGERNTLFFETLKIRAKKNGFSYDEYVEQAHLINNYVLPKGIKENELQNAIRQEAWDELNISDENKVLFAMSQNLIDYWGCLWTNGSIAFFNHNENRYDTNDMILKGYLQEKYKFENITTGRIEEVFKQMNIQLQTKPIYWRERDNEYILCKDKLVSVLKDEIRENTRTIYTDVYYPYELMTKEEFDNFNGRAKSFMEEISCYNKEKNPDVLKIIFECIGCMLAPTKPFAKIFIWYGNGANGKSLLLKLVKKIMGKFMTHSNILNVNEKFALESVITGIANVTDDVGITTIKETGILKSLIDGGDIEVNRKYKNSIWWKPNSQFIICCNSVPKIADTTQGMIRRLAFVPFEMQLDKKQIDIKLEDKLLNDIDNLRYIMTGAIFAYREAIKRGKLTEIEKQKDLMNDFLDENKTSIELFFDYLKEQQGSIDNLYKYLDGKTTDEIYFDYQEYRKPDPNIEKQKTFTRRFKRLLNSQITTERCTINGVSFTKYVLK